MLEGQTRELSDLREEGSPVCHEPRMALLPFTHEVIECIHRSELLECYLHSAASTHHYTGAGAEGRASGKPRGVFHDFQLTVLLITP